MATTTNYGWTTPDDTALVKDGAAAIRSLGSSIDTSLNTALGTKKAGLVLLTSATFTGVSSVSAPNSTFTSTYENYKVVLDLNSIASDGNLTVRFRTAGVDNSNTSYANMTAYVSTAGTLTAYTANTGATAFSAFPTDSGTSSHNYSAVLEINRPQLVDFTTISIIGTGVTNTGTYLSVFGGGVFYATTQFDSLSFLHGSNIAGRYSIYGYNI